MLEDGGRNDRVNVWNMEKGMRGLMCGIWGKE